jgi:hypothetical protein
VQKAQALITWQSLCSSDLFGRAGKVALLFWDELTLEVPRAPDVDKIRSFLEQAEPGITPATIEEVCRRFIPIQERLPDHQMIYPHDWEERVETEVFRRINASVREALSEEPPETLSRSLDHDAFKLSIAATATIDAWLRLQKDGCQLLGHRYEDAALRAAVSSPSWTNTGSPYVEMILGGIPRVGELSWNQIVELRAHPKYEMFRQKCFEVAALLDAGHRDDASRLLTDAINTSLRKVALAVRPAIGITAIKGVLGNIPLPIPVNPLSIWSSAESIHREHKLERAHGWLYFVLDAEMK